MAETAQEEKAKLNLNVKIEDIGPARKKLTIEVPADDIAAKVEEGYTNLNSDAQIPGFRKGRAPRKLVEKRFGSAIRDDVRAQLMSEAYGQAIEDNELDVIGEPDVKDADEVELPEDGSLTFEIEVEVSPQVELPKFEDLKITKTKAEVTDDEVQEEIDRMAQQHGKPAELAPDVKADHQDYLMTDVHIYAGKDAGEDAEVLAHHHDSYVYVTGEKQEYKGHVAGIVVPDLGKTLTGKTVGEEVSISTQGPDNHENDKIKAQPITIKMAIKKIERIEAAKEEELPAQLGFETVDAMKEKIREFLTERNERRQQSELHEQVTDQLVEKVDLELPEGLTSRQIERSLQRQAMQLAYTGTDENEIEQKLAEARSDSEADIRKQLKTFFILDKAAKDLEVEVGENEINGRISMMAMQQGRRPEKLRQEMAHRGELEHLYLSIREQKTLDAIIEKAKVTEVEASADDAGDEKKTTKKKTTKKKSTKKKADDAK